MSNINNHGVGMNKINLATDFQELTCEQAAAIQGGAAVDLFVDANFTRPLLSTDSSIAEGATSSPKDIRDKDLTESW